MVTNLKKTNTDKNIPDVIHKHGNDNKSKVKNKIIYQFSILHLLASAK